MSDAALRDAEQLVRTIADTALENEKYFCDLDAVVGDGDFGYSLARGFGKVVDDWDAMEYEDVSGLFKKTALVLSGRRRASSDLGYRVPARWHGAEGHRILRQRMRRCARAAIEGTQAARGVGPRRQDPAGRPNPRNRPAGAGVRGGASASDALEAAAETARERRSDQGMLAKKGRAAYSGERSRESVDAGAIAIAVLRARQHRPAPHHCLGPPPGRGGVT